MREESGQASVEAAFLLPLLFALFGLLLQPSILLYDRCVMNDAASQGCRLLATATTGQDTVTDFIERRLSSIPCVACFHEGADWQIELSGGEGKDVQSVRIVNHAQALPLFGITAGLAGQVDSDGFIELEVEQSANCIPTWAHEGDPATWIAHWK
jgi:hypothetical protein